MIEAITINYVHLIFLSQISLLNDILLQLNIISNFTSYKDELYICHNQI